MGKGAPGAAHFPLNHAQTSQATVSYPVEGNEIFHTLEERSFWFRHRNDCILAVVRRLPPNGELFDVGGGNGFVALHLQSHGFPVALLEPGSGARRARERGVRRVIQSDLEHAGLEKGSVSAVGLFDVVEHIRDDRAFLMEIHRLLRPRGRLYLTVPAYGWLWSREDEAAGHFRRYSRRGLGRLLREVGFEVDYLTALFSWLPPAIALLRTLPRLLRGPASGGLSRQRQERDHTPSPFVGPLLDVLSRWEQGMIRKGGGLPFGSSWMAVATRI